MQALYRQGMRLFALLSFATLVFALFPQAATAAGWRTIAVSDQTVLMAATQYEESPTGSLAYVYFRMHNRTDDRLYAHVQAEVMCEPSGQVIPVQLHLNPEDMGISATPPNSIPYFAQSVCAPGEKVEHIRATIQTQLDDTESPDNLQAATAPLPPPPPGYGLPPLSRRVHRTPPGDIHSKGWRLEFNYGLSTFWVPTRSTNLNDAGTFDASTIRIAGALGPRLELAYWPLVSRRLSLGLTGLAEGGAMGLSSGYTDATHLELQITAQAGDALSFSGLAKVAYGYRFAERHTGTPFSVAHQDASIGSQLVRPSVGLRTCLRSRQTMPFCDMGVDIGVAFEMPAYTAARNGGLILQGSYWLRHMVGVQLEGGWSYPVGGRSIVAANDDGRSGFFGASVLLSDDFFNIYTRQPH